MKHWREELSDRQREELEMAAKYVEEYPEEKKAWAHVAVHLIHKLAQLLDARHTHPAAGDTLRVTERDEQ